MSEWELRHVLALPARIVGRFDNARWTVSGLSDDHWGTALVSLHEAEHAGLNAGTAWGLLLQAVHLGARPDHAPAMRRTLVKHCAPVHEAFATHASLAHVVGRTSAPDLATFASRYPAYADHLDTALALGPDGAFESQWRRVACHAALRTCFQSDVLSALLRRGPRDLSLDDLRDRETPNARYKILRGRRKLLWDRVERRASDRFGDEWAELRSLTSREGGAEQDAWHTLDALCTDAAAEVLAETGRTTLTPSEVRAAYRPLVDALDEVDAPVLLDTDVTGMFEAEQLRLREPRPAHVRPRRTADFAADPHVLIVARPPAAVRRQFVLDDPWPPDGSRPVVAVQARRANEAAVRLYPLDEPGDLESLPPGIPVLAAISVSSARDAGWAGRWSDTILTRSAQTVLLLDTPFNQSIDALLAAGGDFRYGVFPLGETPGSAHAFVCATGDFPPVVRLCTPLAGQALLAHVDRLGRGRRVTDLKEVGADPATALTLLRRIVADDALIEDVR